MSGSDERYEDEWSDVKVTQCMKCRHRDGYDVGCAAFPAGVPDEILANEFDHRKPHLGDHGIRFEPKPATLRI